MFVKRIHVFRGGNQTSAQGVQRKFSEKDLQQVVDTYNPDIHEAPLVIGHAGDNDSTPAYGWIQGFERKGENLYADVAFTDTAKDLVKNGHYRKVSISFYSPDSAINPSKGKWSARHLALLGASPPAVKGLEPFSFSEEEGVFDFSVTLSPSEIFDDELGPTLLENKSPLEMLKEKLDEVRQDVSSAVKDLESNQQSQPTQQVEDVQTSSVAEVGEMANPDASQFKETTKSTGRERTEIAQQTADLETQFPQEEFMEKGKISRKHAKGAHGQVMQVVEEVYEESTAERKEAADRGFERKRQEKEGRKGEAQETKEIMKLEDKKLSDDHKEKQGYNDRLDESLGAKDGKESSKKQSMKDRRDESEGMEKAEGKRKFSGDKSMDHSEVEEFDEVSYKTSKNGKVSFGVKKEEIETEDDRYETGRSDSDSYAVRREVGKETTGGVGEDRYEEDASSDEQEKDRLNTAKSSEQEEDRKKLARTDEFGKGDTGRFAGQEGARAQIMNDDQYSAGFKDLPDGVDPEMSTGTDPYGRKESETKIPTETEEMPDSTVFAVSVKDVLADGNMRVLREKSSNSRKTPVGGAVTHSFNEEEVEEEFAETGEKKSSDKLLSGTFDEADVAAETVGPNGAYAEKKKKKDGPQAAETVGPDGAYKETDEEYTPTGYGSTYEAKSNYSEESVDHCDSPMGYEELATQLAELKQRYSMMERQHQEEKMSHRRAALSNSIGMLYSEGRLTDGVMPEQELLSYVEGLEFGTLEFSEGETAATKLLRLLGNLPPMVSFGEIAGGSFQYAEEDMDPHQRALHLVEQSEGQMDYVEALKKTMFN